MGITKLIILALLIWLGFRVYRAIQQRRHTLAIQAAKPDKQLSGNLVQCQACGVHLPKETAVAENGHFYCPPDNNDCKR